LKNKEAVVILGGGVIGFSIAYSLAKEGISSQVIEMDSIASLSDVWSAGIPILPLIAESIERFQTLPLELQEETGLDVRYGEMGAFFCAFSEEEEKVMKGMVSEARDRGYEVTWLSGNEVRAEDNLVSPEVRGAAFTAYGQIDAYRYTLALAQGAEKLGYSIRLTEAIGFRHEKNRVTSVILSGGGEVAAEKVVIAMGPWSSRAGSWLSVKIPLKVIRGQAAKLQPPKLPRHDAGFPVPDSEWPGKAPGRLMMYESSRVDGSVLAGYSEDWPETWDDNHPETWEDTSTQELVETMITGAVRLHPTLEDATLVEARHGLLGYPPDEWPVIGSLPGWDNVYVATGLGTIGVALSPATGRITTDLILGGERAKKAAEDAKLFRPDRFG